MGDPDNHNKRELNEAPKILLKGAPELCSVKRRGPQMNRKIWSPLIFGGAIAAVVQAFGLILVARYCPPSLVGQYGSWLGVGSILSLVGLSRFDQVITAARTKISGLKSATKSYTLAALVFATTLLLFPLRFLGFEYIDQILIIQIGALLTIRFELDRALRVRFNNTRLIGFRVIIRAICSFALLAIVSIKAPNVDLLLMANYFPFAIPFGKEMLGVMPRFKGQQIRRFFRHNLRQYSYGVPTIVLNSAFQFGAPAIFGAFYGLEVSSVVFLVLRLAQAPLAIVLRVINELVTARISHAPSQDFRREVERRLSFASAGVVLTGIVLIYPAPHFFLLLFGDKWASVPVNIGIVALSVSLQLAAQIYASPLSTDFIRFGHQHDLLVWEVRRALAALSSLLICSWMSLPPSAGICAWSVTIAIMYVLLERRRKIIASREPIDAKV